MNCKSGKRQWRGPASCLAGVAAVMSLACGSPTQTGPSEFTIRIDSVLGASAVSGGIAAPQLLWATVGRNGCTSFKELRTTRVPSRMDVTVIGEHTGAPCLSGNVVLSGLTVQIEPIIPEDFSLVIHQPDGSTLVRRIVGE